MFVVVQVRLLEGMTEAETRHERRDAESQHVCLRLAGRRAAYSTSSTVVQQCLLHRHARPINTGFYTWTHLQNIHFYVVKYLLGQ